MSLLRLSPLLVLLLLLSACGTQSLAPPTPGQQEGTAGLWHWQLQGRLALNDGQSSHSASLDWQQQGDRYQLQLFGPLGQGSARLDGEPFLVSLTTSDGQLLQAASPEQLIQQGLGWNLPLSNLVYWVRGLPAPGRFDRLSDQQIQQQGWQVEWRRYTETAGHRLPSLLVATQGPVQLRLAINTWQLQTTTP